MTRTLLSHLLSRHPKSQLSNYASPHANLHLSHIKKHQTHIFVPCNTNAAYYSTIHRISTLSGASPQNTRPKRHIAAPIFSMEALSREHLQKMRYYSTEAKDSDKNKEKENSDENSLKDSENSALRNETLDAARRNIRSMQRKVFQELASSKAKSHEIQSPFIPMNQKMVAKPHDPRLLHAKRPNQLPVATSPIGTLMDALKYPIFTAPDQMRQDTRQRAFVSLVVFLFFVGAFLVFVFRDRLQTNVIEQLGVVIANNTLDVFFHAPYHLEVYPYIPHWIMKWVWDKYDPCSLLLVGEEAGVGKKWLLKRTFGNMHQVLYIDLNEDSRPLEEIILHKTLRKEEILNQMREKKISAQDVIQHVAFQCSESGTPPAVLCLDLTNIPKTMVSDRLWDCIEMNQSVNDLFPNEIMESRRGGIDVNGEVMLKLQHKEDLYAQAPLDKRFLTGMKFIILMNEDQLRHCDLDRVFNYLHLMRMRRWTPQEAEVYLNQRKMLLGKNHAALREKLRTYPDVFQNPKELFRLCSYIEKGQRKQGTLVDTRRHLKKQIAILENLRSNKDIAQDIEALADRGKSYMTASEEHLSLNQEELMRYSEEERLMHIAVLKEELEKVRAQILPFDQLILQFLDKRREKLRMQREAMV